MQHIYFIFKWKKSRVVLVVMLIILIFIPSYPHSNLQLLAMLLRVLMLCFQCWFQYKYQSSYVFFLRSQHCSYNNYYPYLASKSSCTSACLQNEKNILSVKLKTWQCTTQNALLLTESSRWNCSLPKPVQWCSAARKSMDHCLTRQLALWGSMPYTGGKLKATIFILT